MDAFFADGARVIFQLALTVLAKNEAFLLSCADDGNENNKYDIFFNAVKMLALAIIYTRCCFLGEAMIRLTSYFNGVVREDIENNDGEIVIKFYMFSCLL